MTGLILKPEEIDLVMSVISKAVEDIDARTTLECTDTELSLLARDRNRLEILYEKFGKILLSQ